MDWSSLVNHTLSEMFGLFAFAVFGAIAGWWTKNMVMLSANLPAWAQGLLRDVSVDAAEAAEQIYKGVSANNGAAFDYAAQYIVTAAAAHGLPNLPEELIRGLIESAVYEMKHAIETPPA